MRGMKLNAGFSYSGGPLGGTIDILKPTIGMTRFFRMSRKSSVSLNVEGGYVVPLKDDCAHTYKERSDSGLDLCVPESERFLVGGEYSVRGFRLGSLGPQEAIPGSNVGPVGAYSYQSYNLEYIYKINDPLRLVLFADAGAGYAHKEAWDFGKMRYSAGAELRIFLPVFQFPLRFIYAANPSPKPNDRFETFQFTIGNTF
jgi:outer membrane protein assembly factor BamA